MIRFNLTKHTFRMKQTHIAYEYAPRNSIFALGVLQFSNFTLHLQSTVKLTQSFPVV